MDPELLKAFIERSGSKSISDNLMAKKLIEFIIEDSVKDALPEKCPYDYVQLVYDKGEYIALGKLKGDKGGHILKFNEDLSSVGFDTNKGMNYFQPAEPIKELLKACVQNIKSQATYIENLIAKDYTKEVRFGNLDYLEKEFETFVKCKEMDMEEGNDRPLRNAFPVKFDFKGRLLEYLSEHEGNMANVHVTKN